MQVLKAVERVNDRKKCMLFKKLEKHYGGELKGRTVALWGLAFKPETEDMRKAPSLMFIGRLLEVGSKVKVYDPVAMEECRRRMGARVIYCRDIYDAAKDADAVLMVTEWKEFRVPDWPTVKSLMRTPIVLDGRNIYDTNELRKNGFVYYKIG